MNIKREINEGQDISIALGGATAPTAVAVTFVHGKVIAKTDKAVCVQAEICNGKSVSAWFPRKALRYVESAEYRAANGALFAGYYKLAPWFRPKGWTCRFLEMTRVVSGVSV